MNIFESVKNAVSTREAAEYYGIRVNRSGMARCPFHNDRNPSMKLDARFHCFGCGADGDVINFTAKLFGLSDKQAAEKLADDFNISYEKWKPPDLRTKRQRRKEMQKGRSQRDRYEKNEKEFFRIFTDYYHMMKEWKEERAPHSPDEDLDEYFSEALRNLSKTEYVLDYFLAADLEERIDIFNEYEGKVKEYERRMEQYRSEKAGRA